MSSDTSENKIIDEFQTLAHVCYSNHDKPIDILVRPGFLYQFSSVDGVQLICFKYQRCKQNSAHGLLLSSFSPSKFCNCLFNSLIVL